MVSDEDDGNRGATARHTPLAGTHYTDSELNARVRGFPLPSKIWNPDGDDSLLLNSEQPVDVFPVGAKEEGFTTQMTYRFLKLNGIVHHFPVVMLRIHFLLRKYKTHVVVKRLKFLSADDRIKECLYGWDLSSHEERRGVGLLEALYGSGAVQFREDACKLYRDKFGEWLSKIKASRRTRRSISSNTKLLEQFSVECGIIEMLRRAIDDAESASSEWSPILSGKYTPSLNKLHRIVNPKKDGVDWMNNEEMFAVSIIVSFFGCTNAAFIYPRLVEIEDVLQVLCFFGRVNLGEIWPTVGEAKAFLKYCDVDRGEAVSSIAEHVIAVADNICGWTRFRAELTDVCRKTTEAYDAGQILMRRPGRLWSMV